MSVKVFRGLTIVDGHMFLEPRWPSAASFMPGDVLAYLQELPNRAEGTGPAWRMMVRIERPMRAQGRGERRHDEVEVTLPAFLTPEELRRSDETPLSLSGLASHVNPMRQEDWLWLYRSALYVTTRAPRPSEVGEVVLRIKRLHYQADDDLKRLKQHVANVEAIEVNLRSPKGRRTIPDDVKVLVWSRDGAACVKCGAAKNLHFDHIIPLSKGGGDQAENVQLLCRDCNLAKGGRLV